MNLRDTVTRFATETCSDPYGVGAAFNAALRKFSDSTNSGPASRRRILVMSPDVSMFSPRVIRVAGLDYIVGGPNKDQWRGEVIRVKYPLIPADLTFQVGSIRQVITNALPARLIYMSPSYAKGTVADEESSAMHSNFYVICSQYETLAKGQILKQGSKYYRIKNNPYLDDAQFQVVEAVLLESPLQTLTFVKNAGYNPATDTITNGTSASISAFVEDAYLAYDHTTERYQSLKPGDKNITIAPAQAPVARDKIGDYLILTIETLSGPAYSCHCRRA